MCTQTQTQIKGVKNESNWNVTEIGGPKDWTSLTST